MQIQMKSTLSRKSKWLAVFLCPLWTLAARADVSSLQMPYRKLLSDVYQAQSGKKLDLDKLLYVLPPSSLQETPEANVQLKTQEWNKENPLALQPQLLSRLQSLESSGNSTSSLFNRERLRKKPVTLVIVPGVFGEFIDPLAFNEITASKTSSQGKAFAAKLAKLQEQSQTRGACHSGTESYCDSHFSLETMSLSQEGSQVKSLDELLAVSSIDDKDGTALVNVVIFKTPRMSLESMGEIKDIAALFNRRLQKYFSVMGAPESYAYVGYSRGTMVALEMLRQSQDSRAKGLFVVGGVTLGSDLADQILVPGTVVNKQLAALRKLANGLKLTHNLGFFEAGRTRLANMGLWLQFIGEMASIPNMQAMSLPEQMAAAQKFLKTQIEKNKNVDLKAVLSLALSVASKYGLIEQSPSFPYLSVNSISQEAYSLNVARFQKFVDQAVKAATELTTPARAQWWTRAQLPAHFTLYTFAGTLADPKSSQSDENSLARSQWASGPFAGADYLGLLENYRDLRKASGASMNDSQVAVAKVIGWPGVIHNLNPQIDMQTKFLGLFGCHHWAFALPVVNANKDQSLNPFPRSAFLESMAHVFASDKNNE